MNDLGRLDAFQCICIRRGCAHRRTQFRVPERRKFKRELWAIDCSDAYSRI